MSIVLAVDGGNSKTDVVLVRDDGYVVGSVRGPGCSPHRLGIDGSLDVLEALVSELGGNADLAVLLLAALDFPDEEDAYHAAASARGWAPETIVGNDTYAVLRAGSDHPYGIAVTCGAGINCVGVAPDGRRVRFASLGDISGDWGGGEDVGMAALAAAARSEDGRGPWTSLEQRVPAYFGAATPLELARALHAGRVTEEQLGELAPLVFALAEEDGTARAIVERLADEVVAFVRATATQLELADAALDVVLGGSLLQARNPILLTAIEKGVGAVGSGLIVRVVESPPVLGAALAGLDRLGGAPEAAAKLRSAFAR